MPAGADTEHQCAEDWYNAYGWHLTTGELGDVPLQAVAYDWLESASEDNVLERLSWDREELTKEEADTLVAKARDIRGESEAIVDAIDAAVTAYERGNLKSCRENLAWAYRRESDHGDTPATMALAKKLLLCARE